MPPIRTGPMARYTETFITIYYLPVLFKYHKNTDISIELSFWEKNIRPTTYLSFNLDRNLVFLV